MIKFSDRPDLSFIGVDGVKSYTVYVYSSRRAVIRQVTLRAVGIGAADSSCLPGAAKDSLVCGAGRSIMAAPGGYRLVVTAAERPTGRACVAQGGLESLQFCADLVWPRP